MSRDREQVETGLVSNEAIMWSDAFKAGVEDVRSGRPARFNEFADDWSYERGRQWATIAPMSMPLTIRGRINPKALAIFGSEDFI